MIETRTLQAVIVSPLSGELRPVRHLIAQALRESNVTPISLEETIGSGDAWKSVILEAIEKSDFIVAVLTGNNPNVMYEIGFAHGRKKPVLFVMQQDDGQVPAYVEGNLFLLYEPTKQDELRYNIQAWVKRHFSVSPMSIQR